MIDFSTVDYFVVGKPLSAELPKKVFERDFVLRFDELLRLGFELCDGNGLGVGGPVPTEVREDEVCNHKAFSIALGANDTRDDVGVELGDSPARSLGV